MLRFMICRGSQAGTQWAHQAFNLMLQPPCRSWKTMSHLVRDKGPDVRGSTFIWVIRTPEELGNRKGP